ncbi:MAG TPA: glycosyltransferase family 39 protein, partial [Verrucomicrobiae bacterium]|nr:glycosyltransferase family 39 protein [Verrucomicrobiae bacterium]
MTQDVSESARVARSQPAVNGDKRNWIIGLLLVAAVIIAYHPAWHGGFIWDDDAYVTGNKLLWSSDGLRRIWFSFDSPSQYFPLTYTVLRLEYSLWGLNPTGYHWVNILLHAANALLLWQLLRKLNVPGAWLAAGIWALHPVQVESVAWVTELKNVLMCFFFLLALLAWVEFVEGEPQRKWLNYTLAIVFYALSLFSKTTACTLPAALLLILWLKNRPLQLRRWVEIVPFVAIGMGMGLLTVWWERFHQGTQGGSFAMTIPDRLLL